MNTKIEEIDVQTAGRIAAACLKEIHEIDTSIYTSIEISDIINCLYAVRRAKVQEKLGLAERNV